MAIIRMLAINNHILSTSSSFIYYDRQGQGDCKQSFKIKFDIIYVVNIDPLIVIVIHIDYYSHNHIIYNYAYNYHNLNY